MTWPGDRLHGYDAVMTDSKHMDAHAVRATVQGDVRAFGGLVERHFGLVYMLGYARLRDRHAAEDLAQEVFLRAYLNLAHVDPPERFSAWVSQIARNLACDWLKDHQRASSLKAMVPIEQLGEGAAHDAPPSERLERDEQAKVIHGAIDGLPAEQRELVLLHYAEQLSQAEIAGRLGLTPSTVNRHLKRAMKALQGPLESALYASTHELRPGRPALARTLALVASLGVMSAATKAAVAAAASGIASAGLASASTGTIGTAGGGGFAGSATQATWALATGGTVMTMGTKLTAAIAGILVAAGGAYYLLGSDQKPAPVPTVTPAPAPAPAPAAPARTIAARLPAPEPPIEPEPAPAIEPVAAAPEPPPIEDPPPLEEPAPANELDFSTPTATVTSFNTALGRAKWDNVIACFLPGGADYREIEELANAENSTRRSAVAFKYMLESLDPDVAPEIVVSETAPDGRMKMVWKSTFKRDCEIGGRAFHADDTFELDATLARTDDGQWLIDNF